MLPLPNLGSFRFSVTQFFSRTSTSCPLPEGENTLHGVLHVTKFFAENFCQQTTVYVSLSQIKKQCIETKFQTNNRSQTFVTKLQKASRCEHQEASTTTDDKSSNSNKYSISFPSRDESPLSVLSLEFSQVKSGDQSGVTVLETIFAY